MTEALNNLCLKMEETAREHGGLPFSACQSEWGICAVDADVRPGLLYLRDCDGEIWGVGTEAELLADEQRFLFVVAELADEAHQLDDCESEPLR